MEVNPGNAFIHRMSLINLVYIVNVIPILRDSDDNRKYFLSLYFSLMLKIKAISPQKKTITTAKSPNLCLNILETKPNYYISKINQIQHFREKLR